MVRMSLYRFYPNLYAYTNACLQRGGGTSIYLIIIATKYEAGDRATNSIEKANKSLSVVRNTSYTSC